MQIKAISPSRFPNRLIINFDTGLRWPLFIDDVVRLQLKPTLTVDSKLLATISLVSLTYLSKEYALRQIAFSPKNRGVLSRKLDLNFIKIKAKYRYSLEFTDYQSLKNTLLDDLSQKGLLNDTQFVDHYLRRHPRYSRLQIRAALLHLGVSAATVDSALTTTVAPDDRAKITDFLIRKKVTLAQLSDYSYRQRLTAALFRKGFSVSEVKNAIDDFRNTR